MASTAVSHSAAQPDDKTDRLLEALAPVLDLEPEPRTDGAYEARENAELAVEQDVRGPGRDESLLLLKAVRLAPNLDICERILRGEPVPKSKLDPKWAKAYGIR